MGTDRHVVCILVAFIFSVITVMNFYWFVLIIKGMLYAFGCKKKQPVGETIELSELIKIRPEVILEG